MEGIKTDIKNKEREKMRKYKKEKYKAFTFAVPEAEYSLYKEFFKSKGGFSRFIRETANKEGLGHKIELIKSAKAIKEHSLKEYDELEGSMDDGI
jgi:hypothetical protein